MKPSDPRALRVVQKLHDSERPEFTILFGSRARGDYREDQSDIDIMLVQGSTPSEEQVRRVWNKIRTYTEEEYGSRVSEGIVWITTEEFSRRRRTINDVVASALRDGIVIGQEPEFLRRDSPDYEYERIVT